MKPFRDETEDETEYYSEADFERFCVIPKYGDVREEMWPGKRFLFDLESFSIIFFLVKREGRDINDRLLPDIARAVFHAEALVRDFDDLARFRGACPEVKLGKGGKKRTVRGPARAKKNPRPVKGRGFVESAKGNRSAPVTLGHGIMRQKAQPKPR